MSRIASWCGGGLAAIALAGCLQASATACDTGGICSPGWHCGIAGAAQVCVPPSCGDGVVDPGEACDDGNNVSGDGCPADCTLPCGDGVRDPDEACDDGNRIDGDGCDHDCSITACGNGIVDPGEACDDGNATDGDGCESNCTLVACGNGIVDPGEACDDGNATDGDGCDHDCRPSCFPQPATFDVTPADGTEAPPGTPFHVDIAITNHSSAACPPSNFAFQYSFLSHRSGAQFTVEPSLIEWGDAGTVASGTTGHTVITVTPDAEDYPSTGFDLQIVVVGPDLTYAAKRSFTVGEPPGCHVSIARELLIKSIPVITDPVRTVFTAGSSDPRNGVWNFKHLMEAAAPTPGDAPAMVEAMMQSYTSPQTVNGFVIAPRPAIGVMVLDQWPRTADGKLDLGRAPLSLEAIVNRFDLRDPAGTDAGELEFELAFRPNKDPFALGAQLLLHYEVPAAGAQGVLAWAQAVHALGSLSGEAYNAALQQLTEQVVRRGAAPDRPNGSALVEIQSYDTDFDFGRSPAMRAFALSRATGRLEPIPLALSPDESFNGSATLGAALQANQAAILAGTYTVPALLGGAPFQGASAALPFNFWSAPGVDPQVRFQFALHTCQGCHGGELGSTGYLTNMITTRAIDQEADVHPYLTGGAFTDPVTSQSRRFNELFRRAADMKPLVCPDAAAPAGSGR